jgi:hypothetical protein
VSEQSGEMNALELILSELDVAWYERTYRDQIKTWKLDGEPPEYFYIRLGARLGHDPHPFFSETYFRLKNPLVGERLLRNGAEFGFLIFLMNRQDGGAGVFELADFHTANLLRRVIATLDLPFIEKNYEIDPDTHVAVADFYLARNLDEHPVDPGPFFSEEYYLRQHEDVAAAKRRGEVISGYQHYVAAGRLEERAVMTVREHAAFREAGRRKDARIHLEENIPGITKPQELGTADALNRLMRPLDITVRDGQERRIHVFLMHFLPEIFFGGYGAFFDFLRRTKKATGLPIRLYVCGTENWHVHADNIKRVREKAKNIQEIFDEIVLFSSSQSGVVVSRGCEVLSYSAETHFLASQIAEKLGKRPFFFIQDDEMMFHPNNSVSSFTYGAFKKKHFGIVNSGLLLQYLVDSPNFPLIDDSYQHCSFENKIRRIPFSWEDFDSIHSEKKRRRLIIYGRPESHAARNQFAFMIAGLRMAVERGIFDNNWDFFGIGSLDFTGEVSIGEGLSLKQLARIPKEEYEEFVASGDIGISMISTPHPGIIHFQMAAFGLVTVTNVCFKRTAQVLTDVSGNIIPVDLDFESFIRGLEAAKERIGDLERRFDNAVATDAEFDDTSVDLAVRAVVERIEASGAGADMGWKS